MSALGFLSACYSKSQKPKAKSREPKAESREPEKLLLVAPLLLLC